MSLARTWICDVKRFAIFFHGAHQVGRQFERMDENSRMDRAADRQIVKASEVRSGDSSSDRQIGRQIVRLSVQAADCQIVCQIRRQIVRSSDRLSDRAAECQI